MRVKLLAAGLVFAAIAAAQGISGGGSSASGGSGGTYCAGSGTNTITCAGSPAPTAYAAGMQVTLLAGGTNTGAVTLNVASLGAKAIVGASGSGLVGGEIISGYSYALTYNGTSFVMPQGGSSVTYQLSQMPRENLAAEYLFNAGVGRTVLNSAFPPVPVHDKQLAFPEQSLSSSTYWGTAGATVTDSVALAPNGAYTASRFNAPGTGTHALYLSQSYVSGVTYVGSVYVMSNTGVAQTMRLDVAGTLSSDITVPTTWTRVFFSATAGSTSAYWAPIWSDAAGDAQDILFWGAQLETGTVPTVYPVQYNHLVSTVSGVPTASALNWQATGVLFNGSTQGAGGVFSQLQKFSTISVYIAAKKNSAYSTTYVPLMESDGGSNWNKLRVWPGGADTTYGKPYNFEFGFSGQALTNPLGSLEDGLWHVIACTYDGTNMVMYVDGREVVWGLNSGLSEITINNLAFASWGSAGFWPGYIGYAGIYSVAHSTAQVAAYTSVIKNLLAARGATFTTPPSYYGFEGDSLTDVHTAPTAPSNGYVYIVSHSLSGAAYTQPGAFARSGSFLSSITSRASAVDAAISASGVTRNLLMILIGTNDITTGGAFNAATFVAGLKAYALARKAANPGLKIVASTLPSNTSYQSNADAANTLIRADSSWYDALADFAANASIGCTGCAANATYFSDGVHPTAAGQAIMATIAQAAITAAMP